MSCGCCTLNLSKPKSCSFSTSKIIEQILLFLKKNISTVSRIELLNCYFDSPGGFL